MSGMTTGPWRFGEASDGRADIVGPGGELIATAWSEGDLGLVVQAPTLLAACELARDVRRAQRAYFADRTTENLAASKRLEKMLDETLKMVFAMVAGEWPEPERQLRLVGS